MFLYKPTILGYPQFRKPPSGEFGNCHVSSPAVTPKKNAATKSLGNSSQGPFFFRRHLAEHWSSCSKLNNDKAPGVHLELGYGYVWFKLAESKKLDGTQEDLSPVSFLDPGPRSRHVAHYTSQLPSRQIQNNSLEHLWKSLYLTT